MQARRQFTTFCFQYCLTTAVNNLLWPGHTDLTPRSNSASAAFTKTSRLYLALRKWLKQNRIELVYLLRFDFSRLFLQINISVFGLCREGIFLSFHCRGKKIQVSCLSKARWSTTSILNTLTEDLEQCFSFKLISQNQGRGKFKINSKVFEVFVDLKKHQLSIYAIYFNLIHFWW